MRDRQRRRGVARSARRRRAAPGCEPVTVLGVARGVGVGGAGRGVADGRRRAGRGAGAGDVELRQRAGVLLVARLRLQDDAILVGLAVDRRDLPLAEGVVERVGDALHRDAEPPGLLAVDVDLHAQAAFLRLGGDLAQRRIAAQLRASACRPIRAPRRRRCRPACTGTARGSRASRSGCPAPAGNRPSCRGCRRPRLQPLDDLVDARRCARRAASA